MDERLVGRIGLAVILGLLTTLGVVGGWIYVWIILGLVLMIFLHELGHFMTAKWSGMKVTEFFLSFGPKIWSFRRGETEYGLKAIPAGAYVRIVGMNNLDEADPADEPRTYRQQSFPKRLLVVSAGSLMHLLQAWILLVLAIGVFGVPGGSITEPDSGSLESFAVAGVTPDSAAAEAGFEDGDRIVAVDGEALSSLGAEDLSAVIGSYDVGDDVTFTVERDGQPRDLAAELGERPESAGGDTGSVFLGVRAGAVYDNDPIGIGEAIVRAPGEMAGFVGESVGAIVGFFSPSGLGDYADDVSRGSDEAPAPSGEGSSSISEDDGNRMISIVGAVRLAAEVSEEGIGALLVFFFSINIFIGLLNMAPLLPLDGGHAAVAIYERIRSRRGRRYQVDMAKLLPVTYVVVLGLMVLGMTALYLDIVDPINL